MWELGLQYTKYQYKSWKGTFISSLFSPDNTYNVNNKYHIKKYIAQWWRKIQNTYFLLRLISLENARIIGKEAKGRRENEIKLKVHDEKPTIDFFVRIIKINENGKL